MHFGFDLKFVALMIAYNNRLHLRDDIDKVFTSIVRLLVIAHQLSVIKEIKCQSKYQIVYTIGKGAHKNHFPHNENIYAF